MVAKYPGRVTFVSENFGESALAARYGVSGYPAIFVDDILVARPRDFGFFGEGSAARRYAPWKDTANHAKFHADLTRMIDLVIAGRSDELRRERGGDVAAGPGRPGAAGPAVAEMEPATLPALSITDLAGRTLSTADLRGKVVIVEFWATWCPPCRSTLGWLADLAATRSADLAVLGFAVESDEAAVRAVVDATRKGPTFAIGTPEIAMAFGDLVSVPTLFVFDRQGKTAHVSYGAPPDLHEVAGRVIEKLAAGPAS